MQTVNSQSYTLDIPSKSEYLTLLNVWEASVRATHHFVNEADITFFKNAIVEQKIFEQTNITVARDEQQTIVGFIGISEASLDMIFVHPQWIGKGAGKMLIMHAIETQNITEVEVNEQNKDALEFYKRFGFKVVNRSELDDMGKPYPVLSMRR